MSAPAHLVPNLCSLASQLPRDIGLWDGTYTMEIGYGY